MKRYVRKFSEDRYYNEDDPDYEYLFKAQSQGSKTWIKIYQTETDKKYKSYSQSTDSSGGGGQDLNKAGQEVLSYIISVLINDYGIIKKIDLDKLGITDDYFYFLKKFKNYKYLEKMPKGSEERKFYYSIIWAASDGLKSNSTITNYKSWFDKLFDKVDKFIEEKGY